MHIVNVTYITNRFPQVSAPGAARRYAPRRWQFDSRRIYTSVRGRLRSPHVAKLQAASVPIA